MTIDALSLVVYANNIFRPDVASLFDHCLMETGY